MANFEPLGPRKWPRNDCNDLQAASILQSRFINYFIYYLKLFYI